MVPPLFTCRACRPHAASHASKIRRDRRLGPDAPVWAPVVCHGQAVPKRHRPSAGQPEQYALDRVRRQIPPDPISAGQRRRPNLSHRGAQRRVVAPGSVSRHGGDKPLPILEEADRATGRFPRFLGRDDPASAVLRVDRPARPADGAGIRRGQRAEVGSTSTTTWGRCTRSPRAMPLSWPWASSPLDPQGHDGAVRRRRRGDHRRRRITTWVTPRT